VTVIGGTHVRCRATQLILCVQPILTVEPPDRWQLWGLRTAEREVLGMATILPRLNQPSIEAIEAEHRGNPAAFLIVRVAPEVDK
jgi:hypothetical protein